MAILTLSGSSSNLNAYPSASVPFYTDPYGALSSIDGDFETFAGIQTDDVPGEFYQILFDTSSITGEAQKYLTYKGIQSVEFTMARNTLGRIVFITNPGGTEFGEEWSYIHPTSLSTASLYKITIRPQDRPFGRSSELANSKIYGLRVYFDDWYTNVTSNADSRIYEIIINYSLKEDFYEFNDSVLTTKAWNSSRYSGRQLQASAINEFTSGDVTYGKTPVLQNYTRNIYLGSRVIGMQSGSYEDETLVNFNGFSYITIHEYITVNDDLSITRKSIRATGDEKRNFATKKGFYPIFYHDFPIGSEIEINTLDEKLVESLKPSYRIFNNSGQLQKLLLIQQHPISGSHYAVTYRPDDNQLHYATGSTQNDLDAKFTVYNQALLIDEFFTGSLIATPPAWSGGTNPITSPGGGGN